MVGQQESIRLVLVALACRGHVLLAGGAGRGQDAAREGARGHPRCVDATGPVHARHAALRSDRDDGDPRRRARVPARRRCSRTCSWPTRSTARRRRRRPRCWRRCRSRRSALTVEPHPLTPPFIVIATQNPIEYEGTYPLPEAQLDRFLLQVDVGYPSAEQERRMLDLDRDGVDPVGLERIRSVIAPAEVERLVQEVAGTSVEDDVADYLIAAREAHAGASERRPRRLAAGGRPPAGGVPCGRANARAGLRHAGRRGRDGGAGPRPSPVDDPRRRTRALRRRPRRCG